jgi:hypothetical protein
MKGRWFWLLGGILLATAAQAADLKVYPGARLDRAEMKKYQAQLAKLSDAARKLAGEQKIFVTHDPFPKVYAFYSKLYKETNLTMKKTDQPMPGGKRLSDAFFCLDGADSIAVSKHWLKVQYPFIGATKLSTRTHTVTFGDVRDVTVISVVKK